MSALLWRYRPLEAGPFCPVGLQALLLKREWFEEILERHGAFHVSVPLGAFGAPTQSWS